MIIFGGHDHESELQNKMYTMNLDRNNLQVIVSNQLGAIPTPRKSCAITVIPSSKKFRLHLTIKYTVWQYLAESQQAEPF